MHSKGHTIHINEQPACSWFCLEPCWLIHSIQYWRPKMPAERSYGSGLGRPEFTAQCNNSLLLLRWTRGPLLFLSFFLLSIFYQKLQKLWAFFALINGLQPDTLCITDRASMGCEIPKQLVKLVCVLGFACIYVCVGGWVGAWMHVRLCLSFVCVWLSSYSI